MVRNEFDDAAEYWNIPFTNKIDNNFVKEINLKTDDNGLKNTLMLVDLIDINNGSSISLCSQDKKERSFAIEKHKMVRFFKINWMFIYKGKPLV